MPKVTSKATKQSQQITADNAFNRDNLSSQKNASCDSRQHIIEELEAHIKANLPINKAELIIEFAKQYYHGVAYEDLCEKSPADLYGALLSHWNLIYQRAPGETKVHVYNPHYEQHGWQCTHTIIEVSHDNMPFLVDSIRLEIDRCGYLVHLIISTGGINVIRDSEQRITKILPRGEANKKMLTEAPIYLEIDRQTDPHILKELQEKLIHILADVTHAVTDWQKMRARMQQALVDLERNPPALEVAEFSESIEFLKWVDEHFIFLGCRDYRLAKEEKTAVLQIVPGTGLGVLRDTGEQKPSRSLADMPLEARKLALSSSQVLIIAKTNTRSTIHREAYTDCIIVKTFNKQGELQGEVRFVGLYTSKAYYSEPQNIPFLRLKIDKVLHDSQLPAYGHDWKKLVNILEALPRDDLFQASAEELLKLCMGILYLQDRQRIRLFIRKDTYGRYFSCLVYVPRERFDTELRQKMEKILMDDLHGKEVSFTTQFSESVLARIHFMVRVDPSENHEYDEKRIEKKLVDAGRVWIDELYDCLIDHFGEAKGVHYFNEYRYAFPASYKESFSPRTAVFDIEHIESLKDEDALSMNFYQPLEDNNTTLRFKLVRLNNTVPLSDALPILENMGIRVINEHSHKIRLKRGDTAWINDFFMTHNEGQNLTIEKVKTIFQDTFAAVWKGKAENDRFNRLVLSAQLNWREITILRAYSRYLRQTGITFSHEYIAETITANYEIANHLVNLFKAKFDPERKRNDALLERLEGKIEAALEEVSNLDDDRIIRCYLALIKATLRVNYYQKPSNNREELYKSYISFKFNPALIPDLPLPRPMFEIFVYSPRFEGVHLRGAKVSRGGIRWSDRREDYRTEVLGLMKAQQVKNAVIVPLGAKGGFVPKCLPINGGRDEIMQEGIACYRLFIKGLLDLTDNIQGQEIIPPRDVVRYDEDDAYLVVAADKGTATFSDIANELSISYGFWLGDAFASGGSAGYDHKKMGITARGAWESVKRHFRELGVNIQEQEFTAIGIGDMAGDVFGNGTLLSPCMKLVAAFNHMHIFVDPNPDPTISFAERQRLFNLPRSTWEDYNAELISAGGGVFKRSLKSIKITPEMKKLFGIEADFLVPNELIRAILRADVDLLWNGGIGTFVKASYELNERVGDRTNDAIRVNADELRCKVVGEGGNLGFTQLGRVELDLNGGHIYTDFIDNSAGVDCSDHEVNIKILLNGIIAEGDMTEKQRNQLLMQMTDEVAELVLRNNYEQTQAISLAAVKAAENLDLYASYLHELEQKGKINRELEFLPDDKTFIERKASGKGLTRPEIAVLLAYSKTLLKEKVLESDVPEDNYLSQFLKNEFPKPLREKYAEYMQKHSLRREIIATQLGNILINEMGITFISRLQQETGASVANVVRAFTIAQKVFDKKVLWHEIEALDNQVATEVQFDMMRKLNRLVRRSTRWFLRNYADSLDIEKLVGKFSPSIKELRKELSNYLTEEALEKHEVTKEELMQSNVPEKLATEIASSIILYSGLDIVSAALENNITIEEVSRVYFSIGAALGIRWLREQLNNFQAQSYWDALARSTFRDDIDWQQRMLAVKVLKCETLEGDPEERVASWLERNERQLQRWRHMLADMRASASIEPVMFSVISRELLELSQLN